jgi:4-hydroxybenzoate polyprenyltransferase
MVLILKVLLGLQALVLAFLWFSWTFNIDKMKDQYGIRVEGATGHNFLRGDIGGLVGSAAILIGLFLYTGNDFWLWPIVIVTAAVIFGRLISLVKDGNSKDGIQAIVFELVVIGLLFAISHLS